MDILTIEDLKAAGFVPLRYKDWTKQNGEVEDPKRLVHRTVPIYQSQVPTNEHPIISYEIGGEWGAQWGAIHFHLRSEVQLWRFMKQFNYPLPIDQPTNDNS